MTKIATSELLSVIDSLKLEIVSKFGEEIDMEDIDYYWGLDNDEKFNISADPVDPSIGQISFDWDQLLRLRDGGIPISYDLLRLSAILGAIRVKSSGIW